MQHFHADAYFYRLFYFVQPLRFPSVPLLSSFPAITPFHAIFAIFAPGTIMRYATPIS